MKMTQRGRPQTVAKCSGKEQGTMIMLYVYNYVPAMQSCMPILYYCVHVGILIQRKIVNQHNKHMDRAQYSQKSPLLNWIVYAANTKKTSPFPNKMHSKSKRTHDNSDDPTGLWANLLRCRLTASNFGKICKCRPTTPVASVVKTLLYQSSSLSAPSIRWGRENEENAHKAYNSYGTFAL